MRKQRKNRGLRFTLLVSAFMLLTACGSNAGNSNAGNMGATASEAITERGC